MKNMFTKVSSFLVTGLISVLVFSGIASAHVTVKPAASAPGAWETYTIKIPSEKNIPTTKVTLKVPDGADLKQYQPVPDWTISTEKNAEGKITTITWSATGKGIQAGEFQQFNFVAQNPDQDTDLAWDAFQYYEDGSIVEWTGEEGSESPHSITKITTATGSAPAVDESHDAKTNTQAPANQSNAADENKADTTEASTSTGLQTATLIVSIAALVLSLITLVMAVRIRKN